MKVLCLWHATDDELGEVRRGLPAGVEVVAPRGDYFSRFEGTYEELAPHADADVFLGWTLPVGLLEKADNLKLLSYLHVGVDDLNLPLLKQKGVKVANIRGANSIAVAEHAMMMILALAKKTVDRHRTASEQGRGSFFPLWESEDTRASVLNGRTLGVIGVGNIGRLVAKYAKSFDMRVLGVRRNKDLSDENVDSMYGMDELHSVLAECDYVVIASPVTQENAGFFGKAELEAMKPSAFLVNIARARLVQEKPLYEALTTGRLRGFASDVWWRYDYGQFFPVSYFPRLPVHQLPNVLASWSDAHNTDDVMQRSIEYGIQSVMEFVEGQTITKEVNLDLGY